MATGGQGEPGNQQYTVFGDGVINTGSGQVINAKGRYIHQSASSIPAGPVEELEKELARIRVLLESRDGHLAPGDREDAIEFVGALERDLPDLRQRGADGRKSLRQRIKALMGVLTPVAGLIGGVAALESILQHL